MRISDRIRYGMIQNNILNVQRMLDDVAKKIATQKNVNVPSDDAIIFSRVVEYNAERNIYTQFTKNMEMAGTLSAMYDASFTGIMGQLENLDRLANTYGTMDANLRQTAAEQVKGIIEHLVTIGNSRLGNAYIFGGTLGSKAPLQLNGDYSVRYLVPQHAEEATRIYIDKTEFGRFGVSGRDAFFDDMKVAFGHITNQFKGDIHSNVESFAYIIDGTNSGLVVNGAAVTLAGGTYTGGALAKEVQSKLGGGYTVAYDSQTRKFAITNNTGSATTFNWSDAGATAAGVLGFDNIDSTVYTGLTKRSDFDTARAEFIVRTTTAGSTTGAVADRAQYQYSLDGGNTWSSAITVNTGGVDTVGDIVIDGTNNGFVVNGTQLTLTGGTYTGVELAEEIHAQLGAGYAVSYDTTSRRFSITNNTASVVTLNWSDAGATAAGVLGFDNTDSIIGSGTADMSDYDAGMFIDGAGVANTTNNRIKLIFGEGNLAAGATPDMFEVKDLDIFELLKNFMDAFENGKTDWVSKNLQYITQARELASRVNSIVAFNASKAVSLIENNQIKDAKLEKMTTKLVDADLNELGAQFNILLNTYQALLSTLARMQSVSILNYLK